MLSHFDNINDRIRAVPRRQRKLLSSIGRGAAEEKIAAEELAGAQRPGKLLAGSKSDRCGADEEGIKEK